MRTRSVGSKENFLKAVLCVCKINLFFIARESSKRFFPRKLRCESILCFWKHFWGVSKPHENREYARFYCSITFSLSFKCHAAPDSTQVMIYLTSTNKFEIRSNYEIFSTQHSQKLFIHASKVTYAHALHFKFHCHFCVAFYSSILFCF